MNAGKLKDCLCGKVPKFHCARIAEDAEECWVECECGRATMVREDAYCDFASAAWDWNVGDIAPEQRADHADLVKT